MDFDNACERLNHLLNESSGKAIKVSNNLILEFERVKTYSEADLTQFEENEDITLSR